MHTRKLKVWSDARDRMLEAAADAFPETASATTYEYPSAEATSPPRSSNRKCIHTSRVVPSVGYRTGTRDTQSADDSRTNYSRPEEIEAERLLLLQRWPDGIPTCPRCGGKKTYDCRKSNGAPRWRCAACRKDFSVTSRTPWAFHKKSFSEMTGPRVHPKAMFYPFMPKRSASAGAGLVLEVNAAVPRTLPSEIRSDVCQELAMAVLSGEVDRTKIKQHVESIIRRIKDASGFIEYALSLDAPAPGIGTDDFNTGATSFYEGAMAPELRVDFVDPFEEEEPAIPDLRLWSLA